MVEINFDKLDRTLVLAELSCNHLQSFDIAVRTIEAMKKAGADVVKVQNDNPDGGITIDCDNEYFQIGGGTLRDGKTLNKLYKETRLGSGCPNCRKLPMIWIWSSFQHHQIWKELIFWKR